MKSVNAKAQKTLETAFLGLGEGESRRIGMANDSGIMPLSVEHLHGAFYSVTHYYEQNGDLMSDPDVEVWKNPADGRFYPLSFRQDNQGIDRRYVEFDDAGQPARLARRAQADLASFMGTWMQNVEWQQEEGLAALRRGERWTGRQEDTSQERPVETIEACPAPDAQPDNVVHFPAPVAAPPAPVEPEPLPAPVTPQPARPVNPATGLPFLRRVGGAL